MSRKAPSDSANGFGDVIGVALLFAAVLLLVAQLSFDRYDLSFIPFGPNHSTHNWGGTVGAHRGVRIFLSAGCRRVCCAGAAGRVWRGVFSGFSRVSPAAVRWSLVWSAVLLVSLTGLLYILDDGGRRGKFYEVIGAQSVGGWLGYATSAHPLRIWFLDARRRRRDNCLCGAGADQPFVPDQFPARRLAARFVWRRSPARRRNDRGGSGVGTAGA